MGLVAVSFYSPLGMPNLRQRQRESVEGEKGSRRWKREQQKPSELRGKGKLVTMFREANKHRCRIGQPMHGAAQSTLIASTTLL